MSVGRISLLLNIFRPQISRQTLQLSKVSYYHSTTGVYQYKERTTGSRSDKLDILNKSNPPTENSSDNSQIIVSEAGEVEKRKVPDSFFSTSIFYDEHVNKFVNCMMKGGGKSISQTVMRDTFEKIKRIQLEKYRKAEDKSEVEIDPLKIFHQAMENAKPVLGTQTMKKKGRNFQVPYPLPDNRRRFLAIKWFITTARNRPGNSTPMSDKLSKEMLDACRNEGSVIQKKIEYHKRAELSRAFAHYRWW